MGAVIGLDRALFIFFNQILANPVLDRIMPWLTESDHIRLPVILFWIILALAGGLKNRLVGVSVVSGLILLSWIPIAAFREIMIKIDAVLLFGPLPVFVLILVLLAVYGGSKGRTVAITVAFAVAASDQVSSGLIKHLVMRTRPCFELDGVRQLIEQSRSWSFPSSHAANVSAAAWILSRSYSRWTPAFWIFAGAVAFSRIYVGVHYPLDAAAGWLVGIGCGVAALWVRSQIQRLFQKREAE
jgi:undecaprenyl-diphosphatase